MKAIHNALCVDFRCNFVGNYKLKYNFESNSQQEPEKIGDYAVGNYKLKYNFESNSQPNTILTVFPRVGNYKLKYNFESNSQLKIVATKSKGRFSVVNWMLKTLTNLIYKKSKADGN